MDSLHVKIPSLVENIRIVESFIDNVKDKLNIPDDVYGNIMIAVTESVNNAIIHGNKLNKDAAVALSVYDESDSFCFSVTDDGNGFDYHNLPDPTSPENIEKENGRGIFLMRNLADDVEFNELGNEVLVLFNK